MHRHLRFEQHRSRPCQRSIKICVNEQNRNILAEFDAVHTDLNNTLKDAEGTIVIKVSEKSTKTIDGTLDDLTNGVVCDVITRAATWEMNGQRGVSFNALAIRIVDEDFTF
jgi:hypothetical protein